MRIQGLEFSVDIGLVSAVQRLVSNFLNIIAVPACLGKRTQKRTIDRHRGRPVTTAVILQNQALTVYVHRGCVTDIHLPVIVIADIICNHSCEILRILIPGNAPQLNVHFRCSHIADPLLVDNKVGSLEVGDAHTVLPMENLIKGFKTAACAISIHRRDGTEPIPVVIRGAVQILINIGLSVGIIILHRDDLTILNKESVFGQTRSAGVDVIGIALVILDTECPVAACSMQPEIIFSAVPYLLAIFIIAAKQLTAIVHPIWLSNFFTLVIQPSAIGCLNGANHLEAKDRALRPLLRSRCVVPGASVPKFKELLLDIQLHVSIHLVTDRDSAAISRKIRTGQSHIVPLMTSIGLRTLGIQVIIELP